MKKSFAFLTALAFVVVLALPVLGASVDLPSVNSVWDSSSYPYAVICTNENGEYWLTVSNSVFTVKGSDKVESTGAFQTYKLNSSNTWVLQTSSNGTVSAGWNHDVVYSTHDIISEMTEDVYFSSTPDFFNPPPPLAEVIQGVAEETIQEKTLPEMAGTMRILALCGVGLIALLVVLKLFGKRSLIYRA